MCICTVAIHVKGYHARTIGRLILRIFRTPEKKRGNWKHKDSERERERESKTRCKSPMETKKNEETEKKKKGTELSQHLIVNIRVALAENVGRVPPLPEHPVPDRHPSHRRRRKGSVGAPRPAPPAPLRRAFSPPSTPAIRHPAIARGPL
jgi:hypothetical protein